MNLTAALAALTGAGFGVELYHEPGPGAPRSRPAALMARVGIAARPNHSSPWTYHDQTEALAHLQLAAAHFPDQHLTQSLWRMAWNLDPEAARLSP